MKAIKTLVAALSTATAAVVLIAGCSNHDTTPPAPSPWVQVSPSSSAAPSQAPSAPPASSQAPSAPPTVTVSSTASPAPSQSPSAPAALGPCSDSDLEVTNGALESADTQRRVVVSFRNMSLPRGRPGDAGRWGADQRLAAASRSGTSPHPRPRRRRHRRRTGLCDRTSTGNSCPRWGNLVVTPPNDYVSHPLSVDLPICDATVSSVD